MSWLRRPGCSMSRPGAEQRRPPVAGPEACGSRGWGFNLDYFIVARLGRAVPAFARRLLGGTAEGESACRDAARRVTLPRDLHRAALEFASTFWLVLAFGRARPFPTRLSGVGAVNHHLLGNAPARGVSAAIIGSMGLSMTAALFAGTRKRWLDDSVVRRHSARDVPPLASPKPYDWVISVAAGLLAAAAFWAGVDGVATA